MVIRLTVYEPYLCGSGVWGGSSEFGLRFTIVASRLKLKMLSLCAALLLTTFPFGHLDWESSAICHFFPTWPRLGFAGCHTLCWFVSFDCFRLLRPSQVLNMATLLWTCGFLFELRFGSGVQPTTLEERPSSFLHAFFESTPGFLHCQKISPQTLTLGFLAACVGGRGCWIERSRAHGDYKQKLCSL